MRRMVRPLILMPPLFSEAQWELSPLYLETLDQWRTRTAGAPFHQQTALVRVPCASLSISPRAHRATPSDDPLSSFWLPPPPRRRAFTPRRGTLDSLSEVVVTLICGYAVDMHRTAVLLLCWRISLGGQRRCWWSVSRSSVGFGGGQRVRRRFSRRSRRWWLPVLGSSAGVRGAQQDRSRGVQETGECGRGGGRPGGCGGRSCWGPTGGALGE